MASWNNSNIFFLKCDNTIKSMPILKHNIQDKGLVTALSVQFSKFAKNIKLDFFQILLIERKHSCI